MIREYSYTVVLEPEPGGGYTVLVPALPEVVTCGDSEAEALAMAKEAIELALEVRRERGEELPEGTPAKLHDIKVALTT